MNPIRHAIINLDKKFPDKLLHKSMKTTGVVRRFGHELISIFDKLERIPVLFGNQTETESQRGDYEFYFQYAKKVENLIEKFKAPKIQSLKVDLAIRVAALRYRIEAVNGGVDRAPLNLKLFEQMLLKAGEWKIHQKYYSPDDKKLSKRDIGKIEELCSYPEFCAIIEKDQRLRDHFFAWAIRDNNGVSQFIQYPSISERINKVYLAERIGRYTEDLFRIIKRPQTEVPSSITEKVICLPFETKDGVEDISILDESKKVELKCNWKLTIKEIFKIFAKKHDQVSELEFFGTTGITNWSSYNLGRWNPTKNAHDRDEYTAENWHEKFPVLELISSDEIARRYGHKPQEGKGQAFVISQRSRSDSDVTKRHSYFVITLPTEDGRYKIIPIGLYPISFPQTILDNLKFLAATVLAKVIFPDLNAFLPKRQMASHPLELNDDQLKQLLQLIGKDIIAGLGGNLVFKFIDENCSYWTQAKVNEIVKEPNPNYFGMEVIKSRPKDLFLKLLFGSFRLMIPKVRGLTIKSMLFVLGGKKKVTIVRDGKKVQESVLCKGNKFDRLRIFNPCVLFDDIHAKRRRGKISFGH